MFWRVLCALGALTFIFNGAGVLADGSCESVTFGDSEHGRRVITMTCWDAPPDEVPDAMSPGLAGLGSIGVGLGLLALAGMPYTLVLFRGRNPEDIEFERQVIAAIEASKGPQETPDWRHGADAATQTNGLEAPRSGSATRLRPDHAEPRTDPTSSTDATSTRAEPIGSETASRPSDRREIRSALELLDDEAILALARARITPDEVLATQRASKIRDLPSDLPYAVLWCGRAWAESLPPACASSTTEEGVSEQQRGLMAMACWTGAIAGTLICGVALEPAGLDEETLVAGGMKRARATTSVDTNELLERSRELDQLASHFMVLADRLAVRASASERDRKSYCSAARLAFADGVYLGLSSAGATDLD